MTDATAATMQLKPLAFRAFSDSNLVQDVNRVIANLDKVGQASDGDVKDKALFLSAALKIMVGNGEDIDRNAQVTAEFIGNSLRSVVAVMVVPGQSETKIDDLYSIIYRFLVEYDLSVAGNLVRNLAVFLEYGRDSLHKFDADAQAQISFADRAMPISILKRIFNDPTLAQLRDMRGYVDAVDGKIADWDRSLGEQQLAAEALRKNLEKYQTAYNFVGLYEAFNSLSKVKSEQLKTLQKLVFLFGVLAIIPILTGAIFVHSVGFKTTLLNFATAAIPTLSLTIIFIYYFRIILRNADSCRSQIMQLELRKALCQFVQNYASYAKSIKKDDANLLDKFENIIFSGIVASDEKLPSTFDGFEQIAGLIKSVREG